MNKFLVALIKCCRERRFRDDVLNGNIYANSIDYLRFVSNDINEAVFDPYAKLSIFSARDGCTPVSCFYSVIVDEEDVISNRVNIKLTREQIDKMKKDLGEYVVIINDIPQFINLISKSNINLDYHLVKYLNKYEKRGDNSVFEKENCFKPENEFRIIDKKVLYDIEIERLKKMAKEYINFGNSKIYRLNNGRYFSIDSQNRITLFASSEKGDKNILLDKLNVSLYNNDYTFYSEQELKNNHYLVKNLELTDICDVCDIDDLLIGKEIDINFNQKDCALSNFILDGEIYE